MQQGFGKILSHASMYGGGISVLSSNTEVEQERQIIREINQITEHEREDTALHAIKDLYWSFSKLLQMSEAKSMMGNCLHDAARVISDLPLPSNTLFFTEYFMRTVNEYTDLFKHHPVRFVNAILVLADGRVIALSNRGADAVLAILWEEPFCSWSLINVCQLKEERKSAKSTIHLHKPSRIRFNLLAFLELFNVVTSLE